MIGQTISHYRILSKLGEGGMGVVYKAEDTKLKRFVALKFLPPELTRDKAAKTRFIHEAQAASALQHNNICAIHEIDETKDGRLFICMDCYDGETLKEKIARGPLRVDDSVDIASQVAAGLSKAHEAGMVHRDIKPANIMVTADGVVKLLDFGLAKLAGLTKVTRTGTTVGTVAYMSPEQAKGEEVDARSDVWSLGAVLYEMLTGTVPFPGDHEAAVLYGILHAEPDPPASRRREVPKALDGIVMTALQKDVGARYESALAMMADLEDLSSVAVGRRNGRRRLTGRRRPALRKRVWVYLAVLAVVISVGMASLLRMRSSKEWFAGSNDLSMAIIDFRDLVHPDDLAPAAGITNLVHVLLTESSPIRPVSPERLYDIRRRLFGSGRGSIQDDQVLEVARKAGSAVFLCAAMAGTTTEQCVTWRLVETKNGRNLGTRSVEGKTLAELANGIVQGVLPLLAREAGSKSVESPPLAGTLVTSSEKAYEHYARGLCTLGEPGKEGEAIAELEEAVKLDSTFALAYFRLATVHFGLSVSELGLPCEYAEKAWAHRRHLNTKDRMRLEAFRQLVNGNVSDAMNTYREILVRWPDDLETRKSLSFYLYLYWYFGEAYTVSKAGLSLYPDDQDFELNYQASLSAMGRTAEALEASLSFVKNHPDDQDLLSELGQRYWEAGLPDSTEAIVRRTHVKDPDNWAGLVDIAYCEYAKGNVNGAIEMLEQLMRRPDLVDDIRFQILYTGWGPPLVWLPAEVGRFSKSFEFLEEYQSYKSARKRDVAYTRIELLTEMGRAAEAIDMARKSLPDMQTARDSLSINYSLTKALLAADSVKAARSVFNGRPKIPESQLVSPQRFTYLAVQCRVLIAEGDTESALRSIRELESISKPSVLRVAIQYREILARIYWKSGRFDEAVTTYKNLLKVYGGHALSHYELGQIYEEMKRPADAKREYAKFLEMWSQADNGLPQLLDARARFAQLNGGS